MAETLTTQALLERARAGDREAFGALAERFRPRLEAQVSARLGASLRGRITVADVLQETALRALGSIASVRWRGEELCYRWFAGIAEHVIRNASRKRGWGNLSLESDPAASGTSPSRRLGREERRERLERALEALPPDYREVLVLARIEGLSSGEIAERLGRSQEAVKKLVARGLRALRKAFGDTGSLRLSPRGGEGGGAP